VFFGVPEIFCEMTERFALLFRITRYGCKIAGLTILPEINKTCCSDSRGVQARENGSANRKKSMFKHVRQAVLLAATTGGLVLAGNFAHAQTVDPLLADPIDQSDFPVITAQPVNQTVALGAPVTLSVQANNANGWQWLRNGEPLSGQTNNVLTIAHAGAADVGLYSCDVFNSGEMVPTRQASVEVETTVAALSAATASAATTANVTAANAASAGVASAGILGGGPIVVLGTPLLGGGSQNNCPGLYTGYIYYSKSISQGWGWTPISGATVLTAADGSGRTNTKVEYMGLYGDMGCSQTTVTIPYPPYSPAYQFAIYFTNTVPSSTNYPLVLTGFNP